MAHHYRCLGVSTDATPVEIRAAYRRLVKETHPDKFTPGTPEHTAAESRIRTLNAAYGVLSDQAKRGDHDRQLRLDADLRRRPIPQQRRPSAGRTAAPLGPIDTLRGSARSTDRASTGQESTGAPASPGTRQARAETARHLAARQAHARAQAERTLRRRRLLDPPDQLREVLRSGVANLAQRRRHEAALASAVEALDAWARHFYDSSANSGTEGDARLAVCLVAAHRELVSRGGFEPTDLRDVITEGTRLLSVEVDLEAPARPPASLVQAARGRTVTSWVCVCLYWATWLLGLSATAAVLLTRPTLGDAQPASDALYAAVTLVVGAVMFGLPALAFRWLSSFGRARNEESETGLQLDMVDEIRLKAAMRRYDLSRS